MDAGPFLEYEKYNYLFFNSLSPTHFFYQISTWMPTLTPSLRGVLVLFFPFFNVVCRHFFFAEPFV